MKYIASIDIGSSAAKGILLDEEGNITASVYQNFPSSSDPLMMKKEILEKLASLKAFPDRIIVTGVGATFPGICTEDNSTQFVQELTAIGNGGLALSGEDETLVISLGTGTAFVLASKTEGVRHLGGSAMGSGTIKGLAGRMLGTQNITELCALSAKGDTNKVDVLLSEIAKSGTDTLTLNLTSSNFAKADAESSREDIAAGIINLVLQNLGVMGVFASHGAGVDRAVLVGGLACIPDCAGIFDSIEKAFGVRFIIPELASFAVAIGAAETVMEPGFVKTNRK